MKPIAYLILFAVFLFFFGITSAAFAGGDSPIDPGNGCFQKLGYSGEEQEYQQKDFLKNRGMYVVVPDRDRFMIFTKCYQGRSSCVEIVSVCRKNGNIVYEGSIWFWKLN